MKWLAFAIQVLFISHVCPAFAQQSCPAISSARLNVIYPNGTTKIIILRLVSLAEEVDFGTDGLAPDLDRTDRRISHLVEKYRGLHGTVQFTSLPLDLQAAISGMRTDSLTVLIGSFTGSDARNIRIKLGHGNTLLISNFENHEPLNVDGGGLVVLGSGNDFMSSANYYGLKVSRVTKIGRLMPTNRGRKILAEASPSTLPDSLSKLKKRVDIYCSSNPRNRRLLDHLLPGFREVSQDSLRYGYVSDAAIVACGNLSLDYIYNSTVLASGQIAITGGYITDNSKVVATKIVAQPGNSDDDSALDDPMDEDSTPSVYISNSITLPSTIIPEGAKVDDRRGREAVCSLEPNTDQFVEIPFSAFSAP